MTLLALQDNAKNLFYFFAKINKLSIYKKIIYIYLFLKGKKIASNCKNVETLYHVAS